MIRKPKMFNEEEYELDNYLNEDDDHYTQSSNSSIWYS